MADWPSTSDFETGTTLTVRTLNNIDVIHLVLSSGTPISLGEVEDIDDLIIALRYAQWYLTEGKYNDTTST